MSRSSRCAILVALLGSILLIGSAAPAAADAAVSKKDLLEMDQKILDGQDRILNKLGKTKELLQDLNGNLDKVLSTVKGLTGNLDEVLATVTGLTGNLDEVLATVNNLTGSLDQVLATVNDLSGSVTQMLSPILCELLGICPSTTATR